MSPRQLGAIVLAAGEAKRFGSAKQVLAWNGQTLVERAVQVCLDAGCQHVMIVTGAHVNNDSAFAKTLQRISQCFDDS